MKLWQFDDPKVEFDDPQVDFDDPKVEFDDPQVEFDDPKVECGFKLINRRMSRRKKQDQNCRELWMFRVTHKGWDFRNKLHGIKYCLFP